MFSDVSPFFRLSRWRTAWEFDEREGKEKIKYLKISLNARERNRRHKDGLQFLFHASTIFIQDPFPGSINSKSVGIYFPHRLLLFWYLGSALNFFGLILERVLLERKRGFVFKWSCDLCCRTCKQKVLERGSVSFARFHNICVRKHVCLSQCTYTLFLVARVKRKLEPTPFEIISNPIKY